MIINSEKIHTPAYVVSTSYLEFAASRILDIAYKSKVSIFFPLKTQNLSCALNICKKKCNGFAASSLFEAKLAREIGGIEQRVHFTSPSLREDEIDELLELCDGISFNSLSQWERFKEQATGHVDCALRINPQLSFVKDKRYDPCRKHSRLGAPLEQVKEILKTTPETFNGITGLHFHTNCDAEDFTPLLKTVLHLDQEIPELLKQCKWINLGGGYLFYEDSDLEPFEQAVSLLREKYSLDIIIEPGASVVRDVCYLVSSVIDIIPSDGKHIAVLDTTVNHMPEVFEYQYRPDIMNEEKNGQYSYILEGCTCLAGDHFGEYNFTTPLEIGTKIVFTGMGAYTMVKAHMFNGINLPSVYALTENGVLILQKQYTYEDFKNRCGADETNEIIRDTAKPRSAKIKREAA